MSPNRCIPFHQTNNVWHVTKQTSCLMSPNRCHAACHQTDIMYHVTKQTSYHVTKQTTCSMSPNRRHVACHQTDLMQHVTKQTPCSMSPNKHRVACHQTDAAYHVAKQTPCSMLCRMFMLWLEERRLLVILTVAIEWQRQRNFRNCNIMITVRARMNEQNCYIISHEMMRWRKIRSKNSKYSFSLVDQIYHILVVGSAHQERLLYDTQFSLAISLCQIRVQSK